MIWYSILTYCAFESARKYVEELLNSWTEKVVSSKLVVERAIKKTREVMESEMKHATETQRLEEKIVQCLNRKSQLSNSCCKRAKNMSIACRNDFDKSLQKNKTFHINDLSICKKENIIKPLEDMDLEEAVEASGNQQEQELLKKRRKDELLELKAKRLRKALDQIFLVLGDCKEVKMGVKIIKKYDDIHGWSGTVEGYSHADWNYERSCGTVFPSPFIEECKNKGDLTCMVGEQKVGPFMLSSHLKSLDKQVLEYVYDLKSNNKEVIGSSKIFNIDREAMWSLCPKKMVNAEVVDMFIDILTEYEQYVTGNRARFWWIPTKISRPDPNSVDVYCHRDLWLKWIGPLDYCQKIYIPMILNDHWVLMVVDLMAKITFVLDSLKIPGVSTSLYVIDDILVGMDLALEVDVKGTKEEGWAVSHFPIRQDFSHSEPDCVDYRCGVDVIQMMQFPIRKGEIYNLVSADYLRCLVALQLTMSPYNRNIDTLKNIIVE